ncbi:MAG: hypothetical protein ACE5GQ_07610, partial [Nitrospinales bacterium]
MLKRYFILISVVSGLFFSSMGNPALAEGEGLLPCEGTGWVEFGASPLDLGDLEYITPMGRVAYSHVSPTDHQYYQPLGLQHGADVANSVVRFNVHSPADGNLIFVEQFRQDDYRLIFEYSCTFYSIFIHINELSEKIASSIVLTGNSLGHAYGYTRIPVAEGEIIGRTDSYAFDFMVVNTDIVLPGLLVPAHYKGEPWKIYVDDPFKYFIEPLRSQLMARTIGNGQPVGGKIDYDIDGALVGNWFVEGTNGDQPGRPDYWATQLSVVYDHLDPTQIRVSFGDFNGQTAQFGVNGNFPDPASVTVGRGLVKYELVNFDYFLGDGGPFWDRISFADNLVARNNGN